MNPESIVKPGNETLLGNKEFPKTYLRYDFALQEFQPVYYGHLHGTTFTIAAKLKLQEKEGVTYLQGVFISENIGGLLNFALNSIGKKADIKENIYELPISLNAFTRNDLVVSPVKISLGENFDPSTSTIRIDIQDAHIENLDTEEHITVCEKHINNLRSCDIKAANVLPKIASN